MVTTDIDKWLEELTLDNHYDVYDLYTAVSSEMNMNLFHVSINENYPRRLFITPVAQDVDTLMLTDKSKPLFIAKLPRLVKFLIYGIMGVLATGAAIFWAYGLRIQISESIRKNTITDVLKIPLYPFYIIALICVIIFIVTLAWHTIQTFKAIKDDDCANEITSSWA